MGLLLNIKVVLADTLQHELQELKSAIAITFALEGFMGVGIMLVAVPEPF